MNKQQRLETLFVRAGEELSPYVRFGRIVFGAGDPDAELVMIGEAPGKNEAEQGLPFVGAAGRNLDALLSGHGIGRDRIYITNIVKYRPVSEGARPGTLKNRTPRREELRLCRCILMQELEIIQPRVVATLGNSPLHALTQDQTVSIGDVHGKVLDGLPFPFAVVPLYHPASVIYNRSLQDTLDADLDVLSHLLHGSDR